MPHGGTRPGAGRPPKALRYAAEVAVSEAKIVAALPDLIDGLLKAAQAGDTAAAKYLVDRVLGRVQTQAKPVAEDYTVPFDHPAAEELAAMRRRRELAKNLAIEPEDRNVTVGQEHLIVDAEMHGQQIEERDLAYYAEMRELRNPSPRPPPFTSGAVAPVEGLKIPAEAEPLPPDAPDHVTTVACG